MEKFSDLLNLKLKILKKKFLSLRKESLNLRFQKSSGQLEKPPEYLLLKNKLQE